MDGVFFLRSAHLFMEQQYKGQLVVWSTKSAFQVTVGQAVTALFLLIVADTLQYYLLFWCL